MKIAKTRDVKTPTRANNKDAGIDFYVPNDFESTLVESGKSILIPSGIKVEVPTGYSLIAFNKSGVCSKTGLIVGACVVDETYQGEIHIHLINTNTINHVIDPSEKIVQFVLVPMFYDIIEEIDITEIHQEESTRGDGGFGSTGIN